jgi:DNA helicase-2/ATP-dependent DNA helicase PcrA
VFASDGRFDVVDWKTGSAGSVDPMQLAIYRLAWARVRGIPVEDVDAAFVLVATGEVVRPDTDRQVQALLSM